MRILLTGAGGPSAISVWKSLDTDHQLHMGDMDPRAAGIYLVPEDRRIILPRGDSPQFVSTIRDLCRERAIELVISTVDAELLPLAKAASEFEAMGVKLALSPADALSLCRDKHALLTRLASVVPLPQSELLTEESAARAVEFPRFAKPRLGAGSTGATVIKSAADLQPLPKDGSYLLQELLPGEEYSVDVYLRGDGKAIASVPRERMKTDSGIAVTARTVHLPDVMDIAIRAAQGAGVRYVANVQFKRAADGVFKLLEINPRFPGTLPLTAAAGIDMPKLLIDEMIGRPMQNNLLPFKEIMVVRYWTEKFVDPQEWQKLCRA